MSEKKIDRRIYQPTAVTNWIIEQRVKYTGESSGDATNKCIMAAHMPMTESLGREAATIIKNVAEGRKLSQNEKIEMLVRVLDSLSDTPILQEETIDNIFRLYEQGPSRNVAYNYQFIIDQQEDDILKELNRQLYSGNPDYNLGRREFSAIARETIKQWGWICKFKTTYRALSIIAKHAKMKVELSDYEMLVILLNLDRDIHQFSVKAEEIQVQFSKVDIPVEALVAGLKYEILTYYGNNGYTALTGDNDFTEVPDSISKLWYERFQEIEKYQLDELTDKEKIKKLNEILALCKEEFMKIKRKGGAQNDRED